MSLLIAVLLQALHVALMLAAAPVVVGAGRPIAARLAGRAGPPVLQPWRDLTRLLRKQAVFAETASLLFAAAPAVAFSAILLAAAVVPSFTLGMAGAPLADLIAIAGLLLLARATLALAAMDSGTALGGLGASRSMALAGGTEPALLLAMLPLALLAGTTNLDAMAGVLRAASAPHLPLILAVAALGVILALRLGEPEDALTHEFSGRYLALLLWGAALRRLLCLDLFTDLAAPFGLADASGSPLAWLLGLAAWAGKILVLTAALAAWETARAGRTLRWAEGFGLAVLLALLAALFLFAGQGPA